MENFKKRFVLRNTEAGTPIEDYDYFCDAVSSLDEFIKEDKKNKNYEPNFYEILDQKTGIIYDEFLNGKKIENGIMTKKRKIFNCGINNYVEEFETEQEAKNFFIKYNLDEDYYIKKCF